MSKYAVIDAGYIVYRAGFVSEERSIEAIRNATGQIFTAPNITTFFGRNATDEKYGGMLAKINAERKKDGNAPLLPSDFTIRDIQRIKEPIENTLHTVKMLIQGCVNEIPGGVSGYKVFIDVGESWRVGRSTLLKYKGNRDNTLRPLSKDAIVDYLIKTWKAEYDEGIESDDLVTIEAYGNPDAIVCSIDKDACGQPTLVFNPDKPERGIMNCTGFGRMWVDGKGNVRGYGRKWLYYQTLNGDATDNYKASCFSDKEYGSKKVFKLLSGCHNDKQAFQAMKNAFIDMYPKPKEVIGWRGDTITIDANYVADEQFDMARMLRRKGEHVRLSDVFNEYCE